MKCQLITRLPSNLCVGSRYCVCFVLDIPTDDNCTLETLWCDIYPFLYFLIYNTFVYLSWVSMNGLINWLIDWFIHLYIDNQSSVESAWMKIIWKAAIVFYNTTYKVSIYRVKCGAHIIGISWDACLMNTNNLTHLSCSHFHPAVSTYIPQWRAKPRITRFVLKHF